MAHIQSELLANQFAEACLPLLEKRYKKEVQIQVQAWQSSDNKYLPRKIQTDSEIVQQRLLTNNFAPNGLSGK